MDGRREQALLLVATSCKNQDAIDEVADWYDKVHLADVLSSGLFTKAIRFDAAPFDSRREQPDFVVLYSIKPGIENLFEKLQESATNWTNGGKPHPALEIDTLAHYQLRNSLPSSTTGTATNGLLLGFADPKSEDRIDEFHDWYDTCHALAVANSPIYFAATRYQIADGGSGPADYLALYESGQPEPDAFKAYMKWPEADLDLADVAVVQAVWTFKRAFALAEKS